MTTTYQTFAAAKSPEIPTQMDYSVTTPPSTPPATTSTAHRLLMEIQSIHDDLISLPSLAPSEETNTLLTRLVNLCIHPHSPETASQFLALPSAQNLCSTLRPLCATAEGELERHWTLRIISSITNTSPSSSISLHTSALSPTPF